MHSTYLDNRFVGDKYKEVMERLKTQNPTYYKIYALGIW
jgi:phage terminase large subunit